MLGNGYGLGCTDTQEDNRCYAALRQEGSEAVQHYLPPSSTAQKLDALMQRIDAGSGSFASLGDEQRAQLKTALSEEWIAASVDKYPVPAALSAAMRAYRAIAAGTRYPHLPEQVREDILQEFNEHFGEGGPDHWSTV